jgi:polyhydroxybutyrate depolymerase
VCGRSTTTKGGRVGASGTWHLWTAALIAVVLLATSTPSAPSGAAMSRGAGHGPRSVGCEAHPANTPPPQETHTITVNGSTHSYLERLPAGARPGKAAPMLVEFHGYGGTAAGMAALTHLPEQGSMRGFVVVTPDGPGHTWQLSGSGTDAQYVEAVITQVQDSSCIDLNRVYATGFSQGAAFTILLACAHRGEFAAIATVAVEFRLGCATPLSLLAFHGTADPAVPYPNGAVGLSLPGVKVRGTLLNMGDWARLDDCRSVPTLHRLPPDVERRAWTSCARGAQVVLYSVQGGGHTWPGAARRASPMYTTQTISATRLVLAFFARHPQRHS